MSTYPPEYPSQQPTGYPPPGYGPTGQLPGYAPVGIAPVQTNSGWAMASLVLGILVFCTGFSAIPAVICGHIALSKINDSEGHLKGTGLATAGLIMGYIGIAILIVGLLAALTSQASR